MVEPLAPIPYARQRVEEADIAAVVEVLRSDFLTQGPAIERFEGAFAEFCGSRYAVALSSATAALHAGCAGLGVGPGSLVWTSPNSFVASANCARYLGASVDFVDIDPRTYAMSMSELEKKLAQAEGTGALPQVVIPVDFSGEPSDYATLRRLSARYGFAVLADASHAVGARWRGARVGQQATASVFSFHAVKVITTGEGGMLVTDDAAVAARVRRFRTHGVTRDRTQMIDEPDGPWSYQQVELGFNYRMTDIQAALGTSQLSRVERLLDERHAIAERYDRDLAGLPLTLPYRDPANRSALHLYVVQVAGARDRRPIYDALHARGVRVNVHYIPIHTQPDFRRLGFSRGDFPEAERYYGRALSLPMYAGFTREQQSRVIDALREVVASARRSAG